MPVDFDPTRNMGTLADLEFPVLVESTSVWTNLPAGVTAADTPATKAIVDLTGFTRFRSMARTTVLGAGASMQVQYSLDGSAYTNLGSATMSLASTGFKSTAIEDIPAAARTLVRLRVAASGGDGVIDPAAEGVTIYLRKV